MRLPGNIWFRDPDTGELVDHHSLVQYSLRSTGELAPLLQIVPSKTDEERLLID